MRRSILGALATSAMAAVVAVSSVAAANQHFVPSAFTGTMTPQTGDLVLGYPVAGLGPNGSGWIVAKGWFAIICSKDGQTDKTWKRRIVEHDVFAAQDGNYKGRDMLNAGPCKTGWTYQDTDWANVTLELYANKGKKTLWDSHVYTYGEIFGDPQYSSTAP